MLIPKNVFPIAKVCADEGVRYAIDCVRVERTPEGQRALATNGKSLLIVKWREDDAAEMPVLDGLGNGAPNPEFKGVNIPQDAWNDAGKLAPTKRVPRPILKNVVLDEHAANGIAQLSTTDLDGVRKLDAKTKDSFPPNVDSVVPAANRADVEKNANKGKVIRVLLDAKLLSELLMTMHACVGERVQANAGVEFEIPVGEMEPVRLTAKGMDGEAIGLLMPINQA